MDTIYDLTGKIAVITGGATGIGKGIAKEFLQLECTVVLTGRTEAALQKTKAELGDACHFYVSDVTHRTKHASMLSRIEKEIGPIDILVNNAGKHCKKPSIETTDSDFSDVIETNLNSLFALTREMLKKMLPRKSGCIINISSMSALYGLTEVAAYSSSKAALTGLTRSLASEYGHAGIRINALAPGFIVSKMFLDIMKNDPARETRILERTPMRRFGTPADIGRVAAFLASDAAGFITGVVLPVDGGNSIGF